MKKLSTRILILMIMLVSLVASPGLVAAESHSGDEHGPFPLAIVGTIFGGVFWVVSTPFCALIAPTHIMDSFDDMVAAPWRVTTGDSGD